MYPHLAYRDVIINTYIIISYALYVLYAVPNTYTYFPRHMYYSFTRRVGTFILTVHERTVMMRTAIAVEVTLSTLV